MDILKKNKVFLIDTLSANYELILQYAQQESIITPRDYNNLKNPHHTTSSIVTNLLDKVMTKGIETCLRFEELLQRKDLQDEFPKLKQLYLPLTPSQESGYTEEVSEYKMTDNRGLCVIINNVNFDSPHKKRLGSDADEESLTKVFQWLGFTVRPYKNQTAKQMTELLEKLSQEEHTGGCFVCCILSHGSIAGVFGIDGEIVSDDKIFNPFNGTSCRSLINKPKVFFIQACRGQQYQNSVRVEADSIPEEEEEADLDADTVQVIHIPVDADFLVVRSTVKGYYSLRHITEGSWFIQSLCKQLKAHCPRGKDINDILLQVNEEVSQKVEHKKQMPVFKVTLRKKLFFRVKE